MEYLIDSNVAIDYLKNRLPERGRAFVNNLLKTSFRISVATYIEVLGFEEKDQALTQATEALMGLAYIYHLNDQIINQTIHIRKQSKTKFADAIIAATAKTYGLTLITRDTGDFGRVEGLNLVNPHEIN